MWLCGETQMISSGTIWLAQDALVYYGLATGQLHCPLGISLAHIQSSCTAQERDICCKRAQEFRRISIYLTPYSAEFQYLSF